MAMGKRKREQAPSGIPTTELPVSPGHPFYVRLTEVIATSSTSTKSARADGIAAWRQPELLAAELRAAFRS